MNQNVVSNIYEKGLDSFINYLAMNGISIDKSDVSRTKLRKGVVLTNSASQYEFDFKASNPAPWEIALKEQDTFFVVSMGIKLFKVLSTDPFNQVMQTYPNKLAFPASAGTFDPQDLETLYTTGKLKVIVNTKEIIPAIPADLFRQVPGTQQSSADNKSENIYNNGHIFPNPNPVLSGKSDQSIIFSYSTQGNPQVEEDTANTSMYLVWEADGFIAKGVNFRND